MPTPTRSASPRRASCASFDDVGIEDDLRDAVAVAQVDEDAAAVVAAARDPAEEHDLFADVGRAQVAAAVGALQLVDESGHFSSGRGSIV